MILNTDVDDSYDDIYRHNDGETMGKNMRGNRFIHRKNGDRWLLMLRKLMKTMIRRDFIGV